MASPLPHSLSPPRREAGDTTCQGQGQRSQKGGPPLIILEVAWGVFREQAVRGACSGQWGDGWGCCKRLGQHLCPAHCRSPFSATNSRAETGMRWEVESKCPSRLASLWEELASELASIHTLSPGWSCWGCCGRWPHPLFRLTEHLPVSWWLGEWSRSWQRGPSEPKAVWTGHKVSPKALKAGWVTVLVAAA